MWGRKISKYHIQLRYKKNLYQKSATESQFMEELMTLYLSGDESAVNALISFLILNEKQNKKSVGGGLAYYYSQLKQICNHRESNSF